jgi:hypothetical protein
VTWIRQGVAKDALVSVDNLLLSNVPKYLRECGGALLSFVCFQCESTSVLHLKEVTTCPAFPNSLRGF